MEADEKTWDVSRRSVTHIGHWIESDVVALYGAYFGKQPYRGSQRTYSMEYPTATQFAVRVRRVVTRKFTGFVRPENVGSNLRCERTNRQITTPVQSSRRSERLPLSRELTDSRMSTRGD